MEEKTYVQNKFIQYIDGVIKNNKLSHAYLIELDDYDKSYEYVINFIKMIICNISYESISTCDDARINQIDSGNFPDLYVVSSDNSIINKKLIIDLQTEFKNKSLYGNKRIYIIKEAEKLNASSANTLLKFLEEPKEDIIAILLTNDRYHVIDTVLSRCQVLSLKDNDINDNVDDKIMDILDIILNPKYFFLKYNSISKDLFSDKNIVIKDFQTIEKMILAYLSNNTKLFDVFSKYDNNYLINILNIMEDELPKLNFNVNFKLWFDSFFARLIGG